LITIATLGKTFFTEKISKTFVSQFLEEYKNPVPSIPDRLRNQITVVNKQPRTW
ncbi:2836_t:CDS:1, partial [Gigaspora rosea]